ncbi:hypothetical protein [Hydrogenimonas sp.]
MDVGFKELAAITGALLGWVTAFTTVKVKGAQTMKSLEELKQEHRNALKRLEETLKKEDGALHKRIELKKKKFDEFKDDIKDELAALKNENHKFLRTESAEQKFVSRTELKLLLDNIALQYKNLDEKMDDIIKSLRK